MNSLPVRNQSLNWVRFAGAELLGQSPQAALLSNGQYQVRLDGTGRGFSECRGVAVSRSDGDDTMGVGGFHIFLRDLDNQRVWSAGYQPTRAAADSYEFRYADNIAEIARLDHGIETCLSVSVASAHDCELRRVRLTNRGDSPRPIEITSYIELVLNTPQADANHPTFSKLFVETRYCSESGAIVARRRPRAPGEAENWAYHRLIADHRAESEGGFEFETNRGRFIGRGRTIARPRALDPGQHLTGDVGPVLDPIASLRTSLRIAPGETHEIVFVLGFAQCREEIDEAIAAASVDSFAASIFDEAAAGERPSNGEAAILDREQILDSTAKRIVVHAAHRASSPQTAPANGEPITRAASAIERSSDATSESTRARRDVEPLLFDNGLGGFTADGAEYVIRLPADAQGFPRRPPQPWCNVIANARAGFLVSESGAGYTWAGNSRLNRLSAWHNDPVCDPHSEALWVRDEDTGACWSPTPGPMPAAADYEVRHGFGYTTFRHESHALAQEVTMFMAAADPVKLAIVRLENRSNLARRLSLFSYTHWALGDLASETAPSITTAYDAPLRAVLASNPQRDVYGGHVACSALGLGEAERSAAVSYTCDRAAFLGRGNDLACPAALASGQPLDHQAGRGLDPCAAWRVAFELPPGAAIECTVVLADAANREAAAELVERYRDPQAARRALAEVQQQWRETLSAIKIETPDREIDLVVNGWLMYQNLSCRIWGRSAYYQPGGAFGFRDQLQDAAAYVYHQPELTRKQILLHASQQFLEGDVLHWWHHDTGYGLRTRFSDDLLWLPYVAANYVRVTGDASLLDEATPFITAPPLAPQEQEAYLRPESAGRSASVYEHCCRALDRGLTTGPHGLPLMGSGDWNDGMNRVGCAGRGESVWLGFFICHTLDAMLPICRARNDVARAERYEAYREQLVVALQEAGWDGAWYRRAYYDNGQPVGSAASDECQIDALAQAWAVISGVASAERAALAMNAVEERLVDEDAGMIRLLTPPFNRTPNDPGYIKGYLPGIRENGGQYTHGVLWVVRAMAEMGRGTRAVELLRMLSPVSHARTAEQVAVYQTEPYVVAADVYGEPPHVGRGGWTWYTGSAGWMFRVAIESIFGMTLDGGRTLVLNPSISSAWPQAKLRYRLPDGKTTYAVTIENPAGRERGVESGSVDGKPLTVDGGIARVPLVFDGGEHHVTLRL